MTNQPKGQHLVPEEARERANRRVRSLKLDGVDEPERTVASVTDILLPVIEASVLARLKERLLGDALLPDMLEAWSSSIRRGEALEDTNANLCAGDMNRAAQALRALASLPDEGEQQ